LGSIRVYVQPHVPGMFSGLKEGLMLISSVFITTAMANALALWSAIHNLETPYRKIAIYACAISLFLCLYPFLSNRLGLPMFNLVLWTP
jgi:hypothetical protein